MEKTTKNGIHRITQADGKTIAWAEESGVKVLEKDGYYFKDLAKTGELLPYEDWRLSDEERAADLAGRLSIEEIAGLMLYSPHQAVPPMPGGPFQGTFDGKTYLELNVEKEMLEIPTEIYNSEKLGMPRITEAAYENPDGTPM